MTISTRAVTIVEYEALPEPSDGTRYELVNGEVIEVTGAGLEHGLIVGATYTVLFNAVRGARRGYVVADGTGFILSEELPTVRIPDVAFIARDRVPSGQVPRGFVAGAPDLAVEVVSPSDRAEEVRAKVGDYLATGTRLVRVLWPRDQTVTVYRPDRPPAGFTGSDTLDGGDVIPDLVVAVADLFDITL